MARWHVLSPWALLVLVLLVAGACKSPPPEPRNVIPDESLLECSSEQLEGLGRLDVALVLDTSMSTLRPSGYDLDGDGTVGAIRGSVMTDRDDTILAAQIRGVRSLLEVMDVADVRFSLVTYSGMAHAPQQRDSRVVKPSQAQVRAPLGADRPTLERALDAIAERGSNGTTNFYAGMQLANRSLIEGADPERKSDRLVLFLSDSKGPTKRRPDGRSTGLDPNIEVAARLSNDHRIIVNTFGLSEESGDWRHAPLGRMAGAAGGNFHTVEDPLALYCHLANALLYPEMIY